MVERKKGELKEREEEGVCWNKAGEQCGGM